MANKLIYYDGIKHADLWGDDPTVWKFLSGAPATLETEYYSRVAAAFRAFNLKANTVGSMPFCLYNQGGEEFDNSATWENKVGFLPIPSELFRIDTMSYMASNTIYNLRTFNALADPTKPERTKGLYNVIPTVFTPYTNAGTGALDWIDRSIGTSIERYNPDGVRIDDRAVRSSPRLFRAWRLDHTTEVLPSPNTELKAMLSAAGVLYHADQWVQHFYRRGGIKPTLIAMKGLLSNEAREEKEKGWDAFLRGIGRFTHRVTRIFNAESMDIQPFGSGVDDMKDNKIYEQAIANIAMATGMPLSLLLANSANYATAQTELKQWLDFDITPLCNWLAYEYNKQIFEPMGLYLEFHPEVLDPQQEDETQRAQAFSTYMTAMEHCPTFELFEGWCETMGLEISDKLSAAAKKYYADKEQRQKEMEQRMQQNGVTVDAEGNPVPKPADEQEPGEEKPEDDEEEEEKKPFPPAKWLPSINELEEMKWWRTLAFRKHKKNEPVTFEYIPRHGGLPDAVTKAVAAKLADAKTEDEIKAAFEVDVDAPAHEAEPESDIKALAASLNKVAEALFSKKVEA